MYKITILALVLLIGLTSYVIAGEDKDHAHDKAANENKIVETEHKHATNKKETEHAHGGGEHEEEEAEGGIYISPDRMKAAGIIVEKIVKRKLSDEISASGEVMLNSYLSSKITPRIQAQIVKRHVKLGDEVKESDVLVTLSSVDMAEAVGEMLVAHQEWKRVKKLGKAAVSAKRYSEAKIADDRAIAKLLAYGMTKRQIKELHNKGVTEDSGIFQLVATQSGTIVSDNFIEGEIVEAGRVLFDIVNEDIMWVETRLSPETAREIKIGASARVHAPGNGWLLGRVVQKHHALDEETRTIAVRIEVENKDDKLHSGMYVETKISVGEGEEYLAVPSKAVLRSSDGDQIIFVEQEKQGEFKPVEIEVIRTIGDFTAISGIDEGAKVVTDGAFFVQSELAKTGFAVHNH